MGLNGSGKIGRRYTPFHVVAATITILTTSLAVSAESPHLAAASGKNRCYSCASENMKENFLTRTRGPQRRVREPLLYDNLCDLDSWMIRDKCAEECDGVCVKWQQIFNNSGVLSYATIRGCYPKMFDGAAPPAYNDNNGETRSECRTSNFELTCIDQSSLQEDTCWCQGDYCNAATADKQSLIGATFAALMIPMSVLLRSYLR